MPSAFSQVGPARLLAGDVSMVVLLLNEVRHRTIGRVFGVSREDSNVMTAVAVGLVAGGVAKEAARLASISKLPPAFEAAAGAVAMKEAAHGMAGEWSRATPFFGGLIGLVIVEKSFGPALRGSFRGAREVFHGLHESVARIRVVLEGDGSSR